MVNKWLGKKNKNGNVVTRFWYTLNNSKPIGNSCNFKQFCKLKFWSAFN